MSGINVIVLSVGANLAAGRVHFACDNELDPEDLGLQWFYVLAHVKAQEWLADTPMLSQSSLLGLGARAVRLAKDIQLDYPESKFRIVVEWQNRQTVLLNER